MVTRVAVTNSATGTPASTAAFAPTLPTHASGDRLALFVLGKYDTTTVPTINQGWTLIGSGTGGTGAQGTDTGPVFWACYAKDAASSAETAPTVTPGATAPNSWEWIAVSHRLGEDKQWRDTIAASAAWCRSADDTTLASPLTGTTASWGTGNFPEAGDAIFCTGNVASDVGTGLSAATITNTGLSGGTVTVGGYMENSLGDDSAAVWSGWVGFTGTATAGCDVSFTIGSLGSNHAGSIVALALREEDVPVASTPIAQVGTTRTGTAASGANVTLTLPAMMQEGDVSILIGGRANPHSVDPGVPPTGAGPVTSGYTTIIDDHTRTAAFDSVTLGAWYKRQGSTPDTQVVGEGDAATADGTVYHAIVLRGVDATTPIEAVSSMARHGGTGPPDPPAVTVSTVDAWVFAVGGMAVNDSIATGPSGYTFVWGFQTDTNMCGIGFGFKEATATGSEDPGAFSDLAAGTEPGAFSFVVKPAAGGTPATGSASLTLSASSDAAAVGVGSASLTLSADGTGQAALPSSEASLSLSATGTAHAAITGSGSLSLDASGTGRGVLTASTASLTLSATNTAHAGVVSGTASIAFDASGTAVTQSPAAGSAEITLSASGAGQASIDGLATLTLDASGIAGHATTGTASIDLSAIGTAAASQSSTASLTFAASGTAQAAAQGAASITLSGAGVGDASSTGTASLALGASGASMGRADGTGTLTLTAAGATTAAQTGTGSLSLSAVGTAQVQTPGTASIAFSASGGGQSSATGTASLTFDASGTPGAETTSTASIVLSAGGVAASSSVGSAFLTFAASGEAFSLDAISGDAEITFSAVLDSSAVSVATVGSASLLFDASANLSVTTSSTASMTLSGSGTTSAAITGNASIILAGDGTPRAATSGAGAIELFAVGEAHGSSSSVGVLDLLATGTAGASTEISQASISFFASGYGVSTANAAAQVELFATATTPPSAAVSGTAFVIFSGLAKITPDVDITVFVGTTRKSQFSALTMGSTRVGTVIVDSVRIGSVSIGATHDAGVRIEFASTQDNQSVVGQTRNESPSPSSTRQGSVVVGDNRESATIGATRRDRTE